MAIFTVVRVGGKTFELHRNPAGSLSRLVTGRIARPRLGIDPDAGRAVLDGRADPDLQVRLAFQAGVAVAATAFGAAAADGRGLRLRAYAPRGRRASSGTSRKTTAADVKAGEPAADPGK